MTRTVAATPEQQLASFMAAFGAAEQALLESVRRAARSRLPTCNEIVYEYDHSLVIGYSPTEKGYESIVSIAARPGEVALYFLDGPQLPDPAGLLLGSGKKVRSIRLESAATLKDPAVEALIGAAIARSARKPPESGRGALIIQSVSKKRRARKGG